MKTYKVFEQVLIGNWSDGWEVVDSILIGAIEAQSDSPYVLQFELVGALGSWGKVEEPEDLIGMLDFEKVGGMVYVDHKASQKPLYRLELLKEEV